MLLFLAQWPVPGKDDCEVNWSIPVCRSFNVNGDFGMVYMLTLPSGSFIRIHQRHPFRFSRCEFCLVEACGYEQERPVCRRWLSNGSVFKLGRQTFESH